MSNGHLSVSWGTILILTYRQQCFRTLAYLKLLAASLGTSPQNFFLFRRNRSVSASLSYSLTAVVIVLSDITIQNKNYEVFDNRFLFEYHHQPTRAAQSWSYCNDRNSWYQSSWFSFIWQLKNMRVRKFNALFVLNAKNIRKRREEEKMEP